MERFFLYDEVAETKTRYVSFMGENRRFDLAILQTDRYFGKSIILDIQSNRFAIVGDDDLETEGYLETEFNLTPEEAEELREFLYEAV